MIPRFPFSLRYAMQTAVLALCLTATAHGSRAPDLARFEARFHNEVKSPVLAGYLKEFAGTVEREWFTILQESGVRPPVGSYVTMQFVLNADGEIDVVGVEDAGCGRTGVWTCIEALQRQQPYGKWTDEMIAAAGRDQTLKFTFFHR